MTPRARAGHETILAEQDGLIMCRECGRWLRSLSGHLTRRHEMSADDYREAWGIPAGVPLVTAEVRDNTVEARAARYAESPEVREMLARGRRVGPGVVAVQPLGVEIRVQRSNAALQAELEAAGWTSLADAVRWARGEGLGWSAISKRLGGRSISWLCERAAREGLSLPKARGKRSQFLIDRLRAWASTHGSLDSIPSDLRRFLAIHRYLAQTRESWITSELDTIDPTWRAPRGNA